MTDLVPAWEVGSDFERAAPSLLVDGASPPWESPGQPVTYFESGRQALSALSKRLRSQGRSHLVMPDYFCESMIEPFLPDGWDIDFAHVTSDFRIEPTQVRQATDQTVVMTLPYFGATESAEWLEALSSMKASGALVVSDETHRVLGPGLDMADFRVASLRKMLPLPDGAYISGDLGPVQRRAAQVGEMRWRAMQLKSDFLAGRGVASHRDAFAQAEELTESSTEPAHMSEVSFDFVRRLDYSLIATLRTANREALVLALESTDYNPAQSVSGHVPSHLVITGPDVAGLRRHLIEHNVFCPIHWPAPPEALRPGLQWPDCYLSIPIDHRYVAADLSRVGDIIRKFRRQ